MNTDLNTDLNKMNTDFFLFQTTIKNSQKNLKWDSEAKMLEHETIKNEQSRIKRINKLSTDFFHVISDGNHSFSYIFHQSVVNFKTIVRF